MLRIYSLRPMASKNSGGVIHAISKKKKSHGLRGAGNSGEPGIPIGLSWTCTGRPLRADRKEGGEFSDAPLAVS